jgi:hypothetical protein
MPSKIFRFLSFSTGKEDLTASIESFTEIEKNIRLFTAISEIFQVVLS